MVAEMLPSSEAPMLEEVASDSNVGTLECKNTTPAEKEVNQAPFEGNTPQEPNATVPGPPNAIALTTKAEKPAANIDPGDAVLAEDSEPSGST